MSDLHFSILPETPGDSDMIERLHDRAFGPGRFVRSSERIREQAERDDRLCFVARVSTLLVGSVRMTPISIGEIKGAMLGPLAVDPSFRNRKIGHSLVNRALDEAQKQGILVVMLVGDESYYGHMGFKRTPPGRIILPGPVDPQRILLWASDEQVRAGVAGVVRGALPPPSG